MTSPPRPDRIGAFLSSHAPFQNMLSEARQALEGASATRKFARGEILYHENEPADKVWLVMRGRVKIIKYSRREKSLVLETVRPGHMFGILCRLGKKDKRYPCTAMAAMPSEVLCILDKTFFTLLGASAPMLEDICKLCSDRLRQMQDLRVLDLEPAPVRLACMLLHLAATEGDDLAYSEKDISDMIGITHETGYRALHDLKAAGCVATRRGSIRIVDHAKLNAFICGN